MICTNPLSCNASKFFTYASLTILVALLFVGFSSSSVFADDEKIGLHADASAKINLDKSEITTNSTAQTSSSSENSDENSKGESNGNSKPNENTKSETNSHSESHENYKSSYEKRSADLEDAFTVETEKHLYKPGDDVKVEGSIWSNLITELGGANLVSIQVLDNNDTIVNNATAHVSSDGQYTTNFTLPADAKKGAYTINGKIEVSADTLASLTLKSQASLQSSAKFVVVSPNAFAIKAEGKDFDVKLASNSNVNNLHFDQQSKKISFTVSGETGTNGTTDITIPKSLLSGNISVMIDGQPISQNNVIITSDTQDEITLELNYHHSTHTIDIVGTSAVPEFPSSVIIMAAAVGLLVIFASRYRLKHNYKF